MVVVVVVTVMVVAVVAVREVVVEVVVRSLLIIIISINTCLQQTKNNPYIKCLPASKCSKENLVTCQLTFHTRSTTTDYTSSPGLNLVTPWPVCRTMPEKSRPSVRGNSEPVVPPSQRRI